MKRFLFIPLLLIFLNSCKPFAEVQCTGVKGFKVNTINTSGIDGDILLGVKNPNNFGFTIYKSLFDVTYSGVYLGKAKLTKKVRIKANEEQVYAFNLKSDFQNVNLMDVMKLLNGAASKGAVEVKGDLKVGRFFIKKKLPVDLKERIRLN